MKTMVSGFKAGYIMLLLGAFMAGCGGGSSSSGTTTTTLAGTAAKGAAFASVTVAIKDKNGSTKTGTTGTDGKYSIDTTGMTGPFLLKVSDGTNTYFSVSTPTGTATANIHPFTDLIIRNWYKVKGADVETDFAGSGALTQVPTASEIDTIAAVVVNILSSWFSTVGIDIATFNLITTSFNADGTGFDRVLDNNTVTIDASGNVTVTSNDPSTGTPSIIATTTISTDMTDSNDSRFSQHWSDGYYVNPIYDNPQTATSVSVSGPGITGSLSLDPNSADGSWGLWSLTDNPLVFLGTTYPATPLTYTFTITTATGTNTATATVDSFMQEFPTNLSVIKDGTGNPVFSWTKVSGSGMYYRVGLHNPNVGSHNWNVPNLYMWNSEDDLLDASTVVANVTSMPLVSGTTYIYTVSVTSDKGTAIAEGSFTY